MTRHAVEARGAGTAARTRLTPAQIDALLAGDWETTGPLRLNTQLDADACAASVFYVNARRLLGAIAAEGGVPVTPDGLFTPLFVERMTKHLWWGATGTREPPPWEPEHPSERDVRPLGISRVVLQLGGLLARTGDELRVTEEAIRLLERPGELLARLFQIHFRQLDHATLDLEPAIPNSWRWVPYALWTLGALGDEWEKLPALIDRLLPPGVAAAENARLENLPPSGGLPLAMTVQILLLMRLVEPLEDFALLASRPPPGDEHYPWYRLGKLYGRFLLFDFG